MNQIKVTIWCTCYNHQKYIARCLDSFVNQKTNFKFEAIIHDDASTDNSVKIIQQYAQKYPQIIKPILQKQNQYSKNVHMEKEFFLPNIHGDYIAFCQGDDYWSDKNKLQLQVDALQKFQNCSFCFCKTGAYFETGQLNKVNFWNIIPREGKCKSLNIINEGQYSSQVLANFLSNKCNQIHISGFLIRANIYKEYLQNMPDFAKHLFQSVKVGDISLVAYLITKGNGYFINKILTFYGLYHPNSWSTRSWGNKLNEAFNIWYKQYDEYTNNKFKSIIQKWGK